MPRLDAAGIERHLEQLTPAEIDALPFGVVRLDASGRVLRLSAPEARQSGFGDRQAVGRSFFTDVAPCFWSAPFRERVERALAAGTLDVAFERVGDYGDAERELRVRLKSAMSGGAWVLIERLG